LKDEVNQGAILRAYSSKDFFLAEFVVQHGANSSTLLSTLNRPEIAASGRNNNQGGLP